MRHLTLITTGGTIEKTYDEMTGELTNRVSIVGRMLEHLRLENTQVRVVELMRKDSLHMTDEDRAAIVAAVREAAGAMRGSTGALERGRGGCGVVILHGTDTLTVTGERVLREASPLGVPVILTGAMRPFEMTRSDALQNLTEAIFAAGMLPAGVYCAAHGRVLKFPGVRKDRDRGTFVK
ncbi:MAG TPA: asparaginase domain-containing protein [Phycisphaerales bacterium]|nr:asparaginase domain-containing protein [Phycisphaerales bacterium]